MTTEPMTRYAALLRAVNVGGRTLPMAELRAVVADGPYRDVTTYIQSGNLVFSAADGDPAAVRADLEARLAEAFGPVAVLVRTADELAAVAGANPFVAEGADPKTLHVTLLAEPPDPGRLVEVVTLAGPDRWVLLDRQVYLCCPDGYGRTKLTNAFFERRLGVEATTRNWRTLLTLVERTAQG
jgi:uncharacterized protein (DUF1697 family)